MAQYKFEITFEASSEVEAQATVNVLNNIAVKVRGDHKLWVSEKLKINPGFVANAISKIINNPIFSKLL